MQTVNLLVIDQSPETAERINSLLRNSGIKIHVLHAVNSKEVKRALDHQIPVLILYADADREAADLTDINELAVAFQVPLALFRGLGDSEQLVADLSMVPCYVINSEDEQLLTTAVARLVEQSETQRSSEQQKIFLEELQHRYNLLLDSSRDAIAYIHEGLHVYANRAYIEAMHLEDDSQVSALSALELFDAGEVKLKPFFRDMAKGKFPDEPLPVTVKRPDSSTYQAQLVFSPARYHGEDCIQMMVQQGRVDTAIEEELERLRFTDMVTRLSNRKAFAENIDAHIEEGPSSASTAVMFIQPDGMAELEGELPVDILDAYMTDLANVITLQIEVEDMAARVSDHGFGILAHRPDAKQLDQLAENILEAFRSHVFEFGDRAFSSSCSIGLTLLGRLPVNSTEVISRARKAHSEAASSGDMMVHYRPQFTAVTSGDDEPRWIERIKYALSNGDFYSVQQSIVDLDGEGGQLLENATFMRGEEEDHPPAEFQAIADRSDLAGTIDRHVIPELLKNIGDSEEQQVLNISVNSLLDVSFPGWLGSQIMNQAADGSKIILQIPAHAAHTNLKPAQRLLKELEPLGCRLAISAFDAERRSQQLLDHLDVAYVKVHPAITKDLTANSKSQETVRQIVEMTEKHNVLVIADEVSDTSSLAVLWQCGVKLVTGAFLKDNSQVLAQ